MFTGIVQEVGVHPAHRSARGSTGGAEDRRIEVAFAAIARERLDLGDSICVDGVCLTVAGARRGAVFMPTSRARRCA